MTTGNTSRAAGSRAAALLIAAFAVAWVVGVVRADEGDGDLPPPEVRNKMCPDLAAAEGRKRAQLELLFFRLKVERAADPKQAEAAKAAFDAGQPADTSLLRHYLLEEKKVGCMNGLQLALAALGSRGGGLLVQWYAEDAPERRGRVLEGCRFLEVQEIYGLLEVALTDQRPVPSWAEKEAPPGYHAKRICDYAYKTLTAKLAAVPAVGLPPAYDSGTAVGPFVDPQARDKTIAAFQAWLGGPGGLGKKDYVKGLPSLLADLKGAELEAVAKVLKDLGVK